MMRLWNNLNQACSNSNTGKLNNLRVFGSNKGHKLGGQNLLSFPVSEGRVPYFE